MVIGPWPDGPSVVEDYPVQADGPEPLDGPAPLYPMQGAGWFPVRPLVFSSTLDWGTLGSAALFHFRTTAGVIVHRFEFYTG